MLELCALIKPRAIRRSRIPGSFYFTKILTGPSYSSSGTVPKTGQRGKVMINHHNNPILSFINDAQYWRKRAEEMRGLAEGLRDPEAKRKMLDLANDYDCLAREAEKQSATMKD